MTKKELEFLLEDDDARTLRTQVAMKSYNFDIDVTKCISSIKVTLNSGLKYVMHYPSLQVDHNNKLSLFVVCSVSPVYTRFETPKFGIGYERTTINFDEISKIDFVMLDDWDMLPF